MTPMQKEQIKTLLEKFSNGIHTQEEHHQFIEWLKIASNHEINAIAEEYKFMIESKQSGNTNHVLVSKVEAALNQYDLGKKTNFRGKVIPLGIIRKIAVAASIVLVVGLGGYLVFSKTGKQSNIENTDISGFHDVKAPETNRATITMANGQKVYLDSVANGSLAQVGNIKLVKLADGQIAYQTTTGELLKEIEYNTLFNPRGSKVIDMTLADGSKVWLNAGSSITYPVVFIGDERKVEIDGEAYFEIAHNSEMPFKVTKGEMQVQVLGTHFNVNAYGDESAINVTLLEGSVNVSKGLMTEQLKPGDQAQIKNDITVVKDVDVDLIMAWKNGLFSFRGTSIEEMLRQIARWYDVDVKYEGEIPEKRFGGKIHRDANISQVLKILEESGVQYTLVNKEILIKTQ